MTQPDQVEQGPDSASRLTRRTAVKAAVVATTLVLADQAHGVLSLVQQPSGLLERGSGLLVPPDASIAFPQIPPEPPRLTYSKRGLFERIAYAQGERVYREKLTVTADGQFLFVMEDGIEPQPFEHEGVRYTTVAIPWIPIRGRQSGFWHPLSAALEGPDATGLTAYAPWDNADAIDQVMNGHFARSVYWKPTRQWWSEEAYDALYIKKKNPTVSGYCADGGFGNEFGPEIEDGPWIVLGYTFDRVQQLMARSLFFAGIVRKYYPEYGGPSLTSNDFWKLKQRDEAGEAAFAEWVRDWWANATRFRDDGEIEYTRHLRWPERFTKIQTGSKHYSGFPGAAIVPNDPETEAPRVHEFGHDRNGASFEASFSFANKLERWGSHLVRTRRNLGLILGTHQLVQI